MSDAPRDTRRGDAPRDPTLVGRLMTALAWAHTRRVRVIVKKGDVRVTMYFSGHERASGVEVLMAIVEAIEDAKRDPMTRDLDKTIEDHEIQKDTDFSDVEKVIK